MKLNKDGYDLIKQFEGLRLKPYLCSAGVPTIGYGNTQYLNGTKVKMSDSQITKLQAEVLLESIANSFAQSVFRQIKSNVNQNQFNALVSFAYNVGIGNFKASTLLKKVNIDPNDQTIKNEFLRWNKAGGKEIQGLTNRRKKESEIYFKL